MADKRKFFRTRRLTFGGHMLPRLCFVAAWLALLLAAGAVRAEDAGLKGGAASLSAGKYNDAVRQLSATINADGTSPGDAAKALYLRGIAYRKMGDSARAAADLGAAIWLGLPDADRVKALVNRGLAFQAAGLSKEGEAEIASARQIGGSHEVDQLIAEGGGSAQSAASIAAVSNDVHSDGQASASAAPRSSWWPKFGRSDSSPSAPAAAPAPATAPAPTAAGNATQGTNKPTAAPGPWSTSVATEQHESGSPSSSSGGSRLTQWFGSLTGSSSPPPPAPAVETASATPPSSKPPAASSPASSPPAPSSSWSTTTANASTDTGESQSKSSWRIFGRGSDAEPATQPAAAPSASGGYRLQLATSRSEDEAKALWKKVSQGEGLEGVSPQIEKVDIGNFGTFYSLRIGPFPDKAQSVKVCNALKRSGVDCSPVTL